MSLKSSMKNLDVLDLGEIKWVSALFGILIAKLFPIVTTLHWAWYVGIILLLVIRPVMHFFKK
ncbi:hypothetical protein CL684_02270 [Candidatus Campbellbacteria bacterium]|nr:hypothetical protein [Candidatus Campbellbacteria bacterium]|tara:strand:+ start:2149 stop:2337 length:189 start_codon:yes stop_codon:yes gene_type:complete